MREIGGYFELELSRGDEYHEKALKLNSGRNALKYIIGVQKIQKVYLPTFICDTIVDVLHEQNIEYTFYSINDLFEMVHEIDVGANEKILYVNYFALKAKYIDKLAKKYADRLIVDNTQAFFQRPLEGIDTFYSPRKFFGVSDGGYLYTSMKRSDGFSKDESYTYITHLAGRADTNAQRFYDAYQSAEARLKNRPLATMSHLTQKILSSIDYKEVQKIRSQNFAYLHQKLGHANLMVLPASFRGTPFVYPFFFDSLDLREKLIAKKIFVAKYWDEVLGRQEASEMEKELVNKLLPLPIDQRYTLQDMQRIVQVIEENI